MLPAVGREERTVDPDDAAVPLAASGHSDTLSVTAPSGATAVDRGQLGRSGQDASVEEGPPREARWSSSLVLPVINPRVAAVLTGLLVGLATVVLVFPANRGCESVRGVGGCGSFGLLALLVIVAIDVFLGAALMAVFVLLFLLGSLESAWMLLAIPLVTGVAFLISWWVTATFVEDNLDVPR